MFNRLSMPIFALNFPVSNQETYTYGQYRGPVAAGIAQFAQGSFAPERGFRLTVRGETHAASHDIVFFLPVFVVLSKIAIEVNRVKIDIRKPSGPGLSPIGIATKAFGFMEFLEYSFDVEHYHN